MALCVSVAGDVTLATDAKECVAAYVDAHHFEVHTLLERPLDEGETPWLGNDDPLPPEARTPEAWSKVVNLMCDEHGLVNGLPQNAWCPFLRGELIIYEQAVCMVCAGHVKLNSFTSDDAPRIQEMAMQFFHSMAERTEMLGRVYGGYLTPLDYYVVVIDL